MIEERAANPRTRHHERYRSAGDATVLSRESEEVIVRWIQDLRTEGIPVTKKMLELKAEDVALASSINSDVFKGSSTWVKLFMNRHYLSIRRKTRQGQKTPEDGLQVLQAFSSQVKEIMRAEGITRVYSADQIGIAYEYLPQKTLNSKGM